jgi:hypothetical protein
MFFNVGIIYKKEVNNMIKNLKAQERITLPFLIVNSVKGLQKQELHI